MPRRRAASSASRFADGDQFRGRMQVMTRRAVGHRKEFHGVARGGKLVGRAAELDLAIVRVRPDANDPHRIESCGRSAAAVQFTTVAARRYAMFVTRPNVFVFNNLATC